MDHALHAGPGSGPDGLDLALQRELQSGERVLWQGRAIPRVQWTAFAIYLFAIPWTVFALMWTGMAVVAAMGMSQGDEGYGWAAWGFPLFGTPFIAVGIGMMATPFWPLWAGRKLLFAVTNRRLIRLKLGRELHAETVPAERIGHIKRNERRDGSGMLSVGIRIGTDSDGDARTESFVLGDVPDIMGVERKIGELVAHHRRSTLNP